MITLVSSMLNLPAAFFTLAPYCQGKNQTPFSRGH